MHQPYVIGIDIGTGSTKAVAISYEGGILASAQCYYPTTGEGSRSEQDVLEVWAAFQHCLKRLVTDLSSPPAAVSLSSAMHSLVVVDGGGSPLTKAILWSDSRSAEVAGALRGSPEGEALYRATGTPLHSMSPLCKIKWLQEHEPLLFRQAGKFISIKEYIWWRLFGEYRIDHSIASATGLFNIHHLQWDAGALAFLSLSQDRLSLPVPTHYLKSGLPEAIGIALGLPSETPFCIGASDGCLANLGSACLEPSVAALSIGTSAAVRVTTLKPLQDDHCMIFNYLLQEGTFVSGGATNNGGNTIQWLLQKFLGIAEAGEEVYKEVFRLIDGVTPGCSGLLFIPYLHGERAPIWDERSAGAFIGVTASHDQAHFARAVAEGVCFALRHILETLENLSGPVATLKVSGGLAGAEVMMQLLADVTGKEVLVQGGGDSSATGAAYLAFRALGQWKDFSSIPQGTEKKIVPRKQNAPLYGQLFTVYKTMYPSLAPALHSLYQNKTDR